LNHKKSKQHYSHAIKMTWITFCIIKFSTWKKLCENGMFLILNASIITCLHHWTIQNTKIVWKAVCTNSKCTSTQGFGNSKHAWPRKQTGKNI